LRWLGASYRLYLQDTSVIQSKHISALNKASNEVIRLLGKNSTILPNDVPIDEEISFCMLASHYDDVDLQDKLHSHVLSACIPLAARGVHAFLEVRLAPELWGGQKPSCF